MIEKEGTVRKFVKQVQQITFSGKYKKADQKILYVTERCVMELRNGKMTITEIAPGIDLERDILANMDFLPEIAPDVKEMDRRLFCEEWGGLKDLPGMA